MNNINEIISYFNIGSYQENKTNNAINFLKNNNIKIDLDANNFNKLKSDQKKNIYMHLNSNDDIDTKKITFLTDVLSFKDKYSLTENEMEYFTNELEKFYENEKLLESIFIDPFNFTRFSNFNNLNKLQFLLKNNESVNRDFSYLKNHNKIEKLGIYMLPKSASPGFKNFRKIVNTLKKKLDLYLFIDDSQTSMDACDKTFFDDVKEIIYVSKLSDSQLEDLLSEKQLTIMIYIYGLYKRKAVVLKKPLPIQVSFQEPPVIYPNDIYDYNFIDKYLYELLLEYAKIDESKYNFITLKDNFILPMPYYSNTLQVTEPKYNPKCIKIGVIAYSPKISHELVRIIKRIISLGPNIYVTIYGFVDKKWINDLFNSDHVLHDTYNNTYPDKLLGNLLYIDSISYNNHSTALEILKLKRPFFGYKNINKYHGCFSYSLMKSLKMDKYFLTDNIDDYVNLIKLYTYNEHVYKRMYHKFIKKLDESKILSDNNYVDDFTNTLNEFYQNYRKQNFN